MPNYLVIGAPKCGTSSLCDLLGQHPDVFMSTPKEIHYFGRDDPDKTPAWYEAHFAHTDGKRAVGEGSTSYTHPNIVHKCAAEIAAQIPDCRLIYMVRNPLARLESDWKMRSHERWSEGSSINEAIHRQPTLITQGAYWTNINVYRRLFSDEQILIIFLEDFSRDPRAELDRCFRHIGVEPWQGFRKPEEARNASSGFRDDTTVARLLRLVPRFESLKQRTPLWLLDAGKELLTKKRTYPVTWDPESRRQVVAALRDDASSLLKFCGKEPDFWKYE
jgi:hypothetical protein